MSASTGLYDTFVKLNVGPSALYQMGSKYMVSVIDSANLLS